MGGVRDRALLHADVRRAVHRRSALPLRALSADLCFLICRARDDLADDRRAVARSFGWPKPRSSAADLRYAGAVNPLASHWFRVAVLLFIASPAVALLVVRTTNTGFPRARSLRACCGVR